MIIKLRTMNINYLLMKNSENKPLMLLQRNLITQINLNQIHKANLRENNNNIKKQNNQLINNEFSLYKICFEYYYLFFN